MLMWITVMLGIWLMVSVLLAGLCSVSAHAEDVASHW